MMMMAYDCDSQSQSNQLQQRQRSEYLMIIFFLLFRWDSFFFSLLLIFRLVSIHRSSPYFSLYLRVCVFTRIFCLTTRIVKTILCVHKQHPRYELVWLQILSQNQRPDDVVRSQKLRLATLGHCDRVPGIFILKLPSSYSNNLKTT